MTRFCHACSFALMRDAGAAIILMVRCRAAPPSAAFADDDGLAGIFAAIRRWFAMPPMPAEALSPLFSVTPPPALMRFAAFSRH